MSQTQDPSAWCADLQGQLMAALDAAWAVIADSADREAVALAQAKAKACGQLAAVARKIAAMVPAPPPARASRAAEDRLRRLEAALAGGPAQVEAPDQGPVAAQAVAQAVAMRTALRKRRRK